MWKIEFSIESSNRDVAAIGPTQARKRLSERGDARLIRGIVFVARHMSIGAQQNRWGDGKANSEVPLQMQLLESDFIDSYRDARVV